MLTLAQEVLNLLNSNLQYQKKLKVEQFKNKTHIDAILNNVILNIVVGQNDIIVNEGSSIQQYLLDFFSNELRFENFNDFKNFFQDIVNRNKERTEGIVAKYKGEEYLCDIEVVSIDPNRGMGTEVTYSISFIDESGEEIQVAILSEYPVGSYSFYDINPTVKFEENKALDYFNKLSADSGE